MNTVGMDKMKIIASLFTIFVVIFCAAAIISATDADNTEPEAKIGDVTYDTLSEAIGAANDNDTIEILRDIEIGSGLFAGAPNGKILIFNGNDHTVSVKNAIYPGESTIDKYGSLTFKSVKFDCYLDYVIFDENDGNIEHSDRFAFDKCTFTSMNKTKVRVIQYNNVTSGSSVSFTDCVFNMGDNSDNRIVRFTGVDASKNQNFFVMSNCVINGVGDDNLYVKANVADTPTEEDAKACFSITNTTINGLPAAIGYNATKKILYLTESVAKIGDKYYESLKLAIEAAVDGDEIDLLCDIETDGELFENIINPKTLIIDGNDHTISVKGSFCPGSSTIDSYGNLTFKSVKFDCYLDYVIFDQNDGTKEHTDCFAFEKCTFTAMNKTKLRVIQYYNVTSSTSISFTDCVFNLGDNSDNRIARLTSMPVPASSAYFTMSNCTITGVGDEGMYVKANVAGTPTEEQAKACFNITGTLINGNPAAIKYNDNVLSLEYEAKKATVTFEMNGHGTPLSPEKVVVGEKITKPADPSETGYLFVGWFKDKACLEAWNFDNAVMDDMTLYAKWDTKVTVSFDLNGPAAAAPADAIVLLGKTYGNAIEGTSFPGAQAWSDHIFKGWYTAATGGDLITPGTTVTDSNINTLYAQWSAGSNITVEKPLSGKGYSLSDISSTTITSGESFEFTVTVYNGYDGETLTITADGEHGQISKELVSSKYKITIANITSNINQISIKVDAKEYTVTLHDNDSTTRTVKAKFNEAMLAFDAPSAANKVFCGYYDAKYETKYYNSDMTSAHAWNFTDDGDLYAKWSIVTEKTGTIEYYDGENQVGKTTVKDGESFTVMSGIGLEKTDCTFAGWNDGTRSYSAGDVVIMVIDYSAETKTIKMNAVWNANPPATTETITVGGTVKDSDGNLVSDVKIYIDGKLAATTDSNGFFYLKDVTSEPHTMTVEAVMEGELVTQTKAIVPEEGKTVDVSLSASKNTSKVVIEEGSNVTIVVNNTQKEAESQSGENVEIKVVIDNSSTAAKENEAKIEAMKKSMDSDSYQFIDASVIKTVDNESSELKNTNSLIELVIAFDGSNKSNLKIMHYHGKTADVVSEITENDTPENNTFYIKDGWIHAFFNEFSPIVIGYTQLKVGDNIVTFDFNGGKIIGTSTVAVADGYTVGDSMPIPTKSGYEFGGWFDTNGVELKKDTPITDNITVYAKWNPVSEDKHAVTIQTGEGYEITCSKGHTFKMSPYEKATFTINVSKGYMMYGEPYALNASVTKIADGMYTISKVDKDTTVQISVKLVPAPGPEPEPEPEPVKPTTDDSNKALIACIAAACAAACIAFTLVVVARK